MGRTKLLVSCLLLITLPEAFLGSGIGNGNISSPATIRKKVTLACPALQEVVRNDGTFYIAYWSVCTSKRCDQQDTTWDWIAGMNNKGITKVGRERVNITSDGALEIHKVNLSDTGQYMCTVKRINHSSPAVHHTTLVVTEEATNQQDIEATKKPDKKDCKQDYSENSESHVDTMMVTTSALSVLLVLAVGYIVYLKRNDIRCWNQGNSSVRESVSKVNVAEVA
ncbi:uncharacterized protein LOC110057307 isoform X2 [Orbicella faveolata]|uniref:uncharacterized protein LOC110057307 isoform X2 n=1 Tax=Orbicella faveolata TaxID=48498 RepID=UPI0009E5E053|nr:uncharacterized protein LOC110057307 isoform X2 [Orbicella faveolata]